METRANHVLIGLFTIIVAVLAVLFSLWASNYTTDRSWDTYDVYFKESVTGLGVGGIVQYNGINVGEVRKLTLDPKDPRRVIARIRLQADTPVKVDTKAKLALVGLTGLAQINLTGGLPESPRLLPTPERKIPVIATQPSALQNLAETANDIVERLQMILSDDNIGRISGTLDDIHQITGSIAGQKQDLAALIKNLRVVSEQMNTTLVKAQGSLDNIDRNVVQNLPELMKKLDGTLAQLEAAGSNANLLMTDNREAIANFSQNGLGQVGPALVDLRALLRELRRVTSRLDRNPGGYVTGRTRATEFEVGASSSKEFEAK